MQVNGQDIDIDVGVPESPMVFNTYCLWIEGYSCTGNSAPAQYLGSFEAPSFNQACEKYNLNGGRLPLSYNAEYNEWSNWGCRVFDNETDARRSFG